jgi:hypothetical protein
MGVYSSVRCAPRPLQFQADAQRCATSATVTNSSSLCGTDFRILATPRCEKKSAARHSAGVSYDLYLLRTDAEGAAEAYERLEAEAEAAEREPTASEEEHLRQPAADLQAASPGLDLSEPQRGFGLSWDMRANGQW